MSLSRGWLPTRQSLGSVPGKLLLSSDLEAEVGLSSCCSLVKILVDLLLLTSTMNTHTDPVLRPHRKTFGDETLNFLCLSSPKGLLRSGCLVSPRAPCLPSPVELQTRG